MNVQNPVDSMGLFDYPDWPSSPGLLGGLIKPWTPLGLSCPMNGGLLNLLGLVVRSHFGKTNAGLDWTRSPVPPSPGNQTSPKSFLLIHFKIVSKIC